MIIRILDEAQADLRDGATFYERQKPGLGAYFLDSLFIDMESLAESAGIHIQIDGYFRLLAHTFPYAIYYRIDNDNDTIRIYAILDCREIPVKQRKN